MNILYVLANSLKINGGIGSVTMALQKSLSARGHKIKLCFYKAENIANSFLFPSANIKSNENIRFLNNIIKKGGINIVVNQFGQDKDYCFLCCKAIVGTKAKLIICHHFSLLMRLQIRAGLIARILPRFLTYKLKKFRELRHRNYAYDNSDRLVLLSDKFVEEYKNLTPNKNLDKLRVIPDFLVFAPKNINLQEKQKTLLFVGRIVESQKRISMIIELWKQISGLEKYAEWNLKIVGEGKDLESIKQKATGLSRIFFEGYQNPVSYYEAASIFLMCSDIDFEGFGMVLIEAQSCGCVPIVMDTWASLHDIVKNEENGFIVPNNNLEMFIDKAKILMDNLELRHRMAQNGIESSKKFSADKITDEWEKLFLEVMNA
jgi:glycosyltransferase involved in cell wall biosynthesis